MRVAVQTGPSTVWAGGVQILTEGPCCPCFLFSATQHATVIGFDTADGWVEGCENRGVPMVLRRLLSGDSAFIEGYAQDEAKAGATGKGAAFQED